MAERQVVRRALRKKAKDVEGKGRKKEQTREKARTMIQIKADLQTARETRRQDWEMGPLAPRRDIPKLNESSRTYYGSVAMERSTVKGVLSKEELDARTAWAGGIKFLNLAIGDRVVVIEGPYKGRIAPIKRIVKDSAQVLLDDTAIMVRPRSPATNNSSLLLIEVVHSQISLSLRSSGRLTPLLKPYNSPRHQSPSPPSGSYTPSRTKQPARPAT